MPPTYKYGTQPWKALFLIYTFLTTLLVRIPLWVLLATPRSIQNYPSSGFSINTSSLQISSTQKVLGYKTCYNGQIAALLSRSRKIVGSFIVTFYDLRFLMPTFSQMDFSTGQLLKSPDYRVLHSTPGVPAVWIPPASSSLVVGNLAQWAKHASAEPIQIPGY